MVNNGALPKYKKDAHKEEVYFKIEEGRKGLSAARGIEEVTDARCALYWLRSSILKNETKTRCA